jgi:VanZ family protein
LYNFIKVNRIKVLVIPLILYWIILFIGTSMPSDHLSSFLEFGDKIKHFIAYLVLAFLLSLNLHFQEKWKGVAVYYLIYAFIICTSYGVLDELHQILVPNRSAEFLDWVADLLGSSTGLILAYVFLKFIKNIKPNCETN